MKFAKAFFIAVSICITAPTSADLGDLLSNNEQSEDDILRPEVAFQFIPEAFSDGKLVVNWQVEAGYYLYRDKLKISSEEVELAYHALPKGKLKQDPVFGEVEVYNTDNQVVIPISDIQTAPESFKLSIAYQGCKEDSVCYPPLKNDYSIKLNKSESGISNNQLAIPDNAIKLSEQDAITAALKEKGLLINVVSFFIFGLLLALTPCVFPMIPILSGIIVGQGEDINRTRAIALSVVYVLAMALTYAVLGAIAGLFSINLQAAAQNPWALTAFSAVFVLLALSMFGFYEIQIPASIQSRLLSGQNKRAGTLIGAAIMGVISAVIVGPCVAPPLAGALLYISQTGNALLGGLALFFMGLGFGVPLLLVGATSGELLPRAGIWMENIKRIFGVLMLGVAVWFLERILPAYASLLLWAILFIGTAIFMGALDRIDNSTSNWQRLQKAIALLILVYGFVLVIGAGLGKGSVLKPLHALSIVAQDEITLPFQAIENSNDLNNVLIQSAKKQQIVMLDFYADWCIACIELEEYTFPKPAVHTALNNINLLQADVTANNSEHKALLESYDLFGPPAILFFDQDGQEIRSHRLIGFIDAEAFVAHIEQVKNL
ncbi:MAG: protein-disulfide reductase DsbD [Pseudomonadota bacterium]